MATAKKLPSGSWRVRVFSHYEHIQLEGGAIRKKGIYESFTSDDTSNRGKVLAESAANEFLLKKERQKRGKMTLREAMDGYINSKRNVLSLNTVDEYERLAKTAYASIIDTPTRKLNQEMIQIWVNNYSVGRAPKTVRNAHGFLSATLSLYEPSLVLKTTLPEPVQPDLYTPSDSNIKVLLKHIEGTELEKAVLLSAFGTLRRSEICALTDKDIKGNTIEINKAMIKSKKEWIIREHPKTFAGYRKVEYPAFVIEKVRQSKGRLVNVNPDALTKRFRKARAKSGLPHFRLHDLRHYSASIMHAIGIPDQYIIERGGWKTDGVMKRIYRNVISDEQRKFTDKINNHFSGFQSEHDTKHDTK